MQVDMFKDLNPLIKCGTVETVCLLSRKNFEK